jgi:hypothetical protein
MLCHCERSEAICCRCLCPHRRQRNNINVVCEDTDNGKEVFHGFVIECLNSPVHHRCRCLCPHRRQRNNIYVVCEDTDNGI